MFSQNPMPEHQNPKGGKTYIIEATRKNGFLDSQGTDIFQWEAVQFPWQKLENLLAKHGHLYKQIEVTVGGNLLMVIYNQNGHWGHPYGSW